MPVFLTDIQVMRKSMIKKDTFAEYREVLALNASKLKSPYDNVRKSSSMIVGTLIHTALLEPSNFEDNLKSAKICLSDKKLENALSCIEKLKLNRVLCGVLGKFNLEYSFYNKCRETGLDLKSRFDGYNRGIIDIKTVRDVKAFYRQFKDYNYGLQAGFYAYVYELEFKKAPEFFHFILIQTTEDYKVAFSPVKHLGELKEMAVNEIKKYTERQGELTKH